MAFTVSMIAVFIALVMLFTVTLAMMCLILRYIYIIIPPVTNEVDRLATGIVLAAVFAPVFIVTWRHMQVDWLIDNTGRRGSNHNGFYVNEFGLRCVSDVDAAVKARLANANRYADIGCLRGGGKQDYHGGEQ